MKPEIVVLADPSAVAHEAADRIVGLAHESISTEGRFTIALSGGSTPRALYTLLASEEYRDWIEWDRTLIFWSDERCVPPDDADSNYRLAHETLLSEVPIPSGRVHRVMGEADPEHAAMLYEQIIRREVPVRDSGPAFDLILLGMGPDGHTASLFPGTASLHEKHRLVVANFVPKLNAHRITFTAPLVNAAANVMFLVADGDKADALRAVLEGEFKPEVFPAQIVKPERGRLTWLVDRAAAMHLRNK
jgi:6-phosphogluconolactonase